MSRDPKLRLEDILEAIDWIEGYVGGLDFGAFEADRKTLDAVVRQFEIIGEAVKALPEELRARESAIPWRQIAGFRDVLAHGYFAVDAFTVWDAATKHLPELKDACSRLLVVLAVEPGHEQG